LTDELALKSALFEQAEANATEAKRCHGAELERRKNTDSDRPLVQMSLVKQKDDAVLQAKLDELLLPHV
jgi:hypothetical protein